MSTKDTAGERKGSPFRGRRLLWKYTAALFLFQLLVFAASGAALYYVAGLDMARDFYSAHRSLRSAQKSILPAMAVAGGLGFTLVALSTWLGLRGCVRRLTAPMERANTVLERLSRGKLASTAVARPAGGRWALDDSADAVTAAFAEKVGDIQRILKEIHGAVLALRYKATGSDPLTLKELREVTGSLDALCKQLSITLKWFET